jgi:hypothetical protein
MEGCVLILGLGTDDDVHFEEGVKDVDAQWVEVCLAEGGEFDNLALLA